MATFKIYKLHFTSPLHIGDQHEEESISHKTISSDTLQAALMACLAKMGVAIPDNGDLGFTLSCTFPYYQQGKDSAPIYFLPMPMQATLPNLVDVAKAKKVKKVQWVDAALYEKLLAGESFFDNTGTYIPNIQETYLTQTDIPEDVNGSKEFVKSEVAQRVTITSRTGQDDAKPYFVDRVVFRDWSGLYFIAMGDTTLLDKGLSFLSQEGIGTDRHVGYGFFEYTTDNMNLPLPTDADHLVSLSLFIPESKEQLLQMLSTELAAYDFVRRGGWITTYPYNTLRKNAIYGFTPGSVFKKVSNEEVSCLGKIVELTPQVGEMTPAHKIWRNGKSIMLPIKMTTCV